MPLKVVKDLDTLKQFLKEVSALWKISQSKINDEDINQRVFHRNECIMYGNLVGSIVDESDNLK